jgi:hypothetical protein
VPSSASCDRELPQDAVTRLHEATTGALLDRIAVTCLRRAARKKRKTIGRGVVTTVLQNTALQVSKESIATS